MCARRTAAQREDAFEELLLAFRIRPAAWLHFTHKIAVPISRSPQQSWWGLVLANTCPVHWVTLCNIYVGLIFRFVDVFSGKFCLLYYEAVFLCMAFHTFVLYTLSEVNMCTWEALFSCYITMFCGSSTPPYSFVPFPIWLKSFANCVT